jgi:hypothetical protein
LVVSVLLIVRHSLCASVGVQRKARPSGAFPSRPARETLV